MARAAPALREAIEVFSPRLPLAVAFSGGADSTALLMACAGRWPGQVRAIYVHYGLQAVEDDVERHCMALCETLAVPLAVRHVRVPHARGQSHEEEARKVRYQAFGAAVREQWPADAVRDIAVAQHADDQVETLLLALSRGAGMPGLAAMPARWRREGIDYHRPLLGVPGAELRAWLRVLGIAWMEDPSNCDERYTRNRIRARLLPALGATFPQFRHTFARSAAHAAQAQTLLNDLAAQDLIAVGRPPVIAALRALSPARQANLLRHWLRTAYEQQPSTAQLDALLRQVAACATRGHRIRLKVGTGFVLRQGAALGFAVAASA